MQDNQSFIQEARLDYGRAKRMATLRRIWATVTGQSNSLIPFEDLKRTVDVYSQHYRGTQPVPVDRIIGSLERSEDFDRAFLPTQSHSREKWLSVDSAHLEGLTLPPIRLYKVGEAYFVIDGHHRVSVARQKGQLFIDAEVTEVETRVPVTTDLTLEDLDLLSAYRGFLEQTRLDTLRPGADIRLTMPSNYARLLDHIRVHKYFEDQEHKLALTWEEAVTRWYDNVYLPLVRTIRRSDVLRDFPRRTEADLYIWIIDHAYYLSQTLNQQIAPWEVAKDYVRRFSRRPRRMLERLAGSVKGRVIPDPLEAGPPAGVWREERVEACSTCPMFRDILVTVTGAETGWLALSQAAELAQREGSVLHGLHVALSDTAEAMAYGQRVIEEFAFRCESLGVRYTTSLAKGQVDQEIITRARWSDMIVINQRWEHGQWSHRPLGTIFQTVAEQAARPILAVPGTRVTNPKRVMLAYDGSLKAREALFVLRHMIETWDVRGILVTVESSRTDRETLDMAWQYIQQSGARPLITHYEQGTASDVILRLMETEQADLLLMGGYGYQPLLKAVLGSTVDRVLRAAWFPVLICR